MDVKLGREFIKFCTYELHENEPMRIHKEHYKHVTELCFSNASESYCLSVVKVKDFSYINLSVVQWN
jgi:hypothetical protein